MRRTCEAAVVTGKRRYSERPCSQQNMVGRGSNLVPSQMFVPVHVVFQASAMRRH